MDSWGRTGLQRQDPPAPPWLMLRWEVAFWKPVINVVCNVGLLGAGSQILRLLLRIPPDWQTITAFPIGLTEETLISEPIFKALYDVTSLKPLDKVRPAGKQKRGQACFVGVITRALCAQKQPSAWSDVL